MKLKDNMEYRKLPKGIEKLSVIGLGLGSIEATETEKTITFALEHGINFFDLCCDNTDVFRAFGKAVKGKRDKVFTQMHFGAVYENDKYGFSRDFDTMIESFDKVLTAADLGYTDFGYIHCIDEEADLKQVMKSGGLFDYMHELKKKGIIHHLGFSSHTPSIARELIQNSDIDCFMFSINPAYDYAKGDFAHGSTDDRTVLYNEAEKRGIGITVMKPLAGGQLLTEKQSPIGVALTPVQCLSYSLGRPAVLACVPGATNIAAVKELLAYTEASAEEKDYSVLGKATPKKAEGRCVYCNHCAPCPAGIDIGLVNKYYDLAKIGDDIAASHYRKLSVKADACLQCGHCEERCPFKVKQMARMKEIATWFEK